MQTRGKKGISSVVTTVLFILIVVAALAVISILVVNLLGGLDKGNDASVSCQKLMATPLECVYNNTDTYSRFSIDSTDINLVNITMIYERETGSPVFKTIIGTDLENLTSTSFLFNDSTNAVSPPKIFSLLPIIKVKNELYTCPQSIKINCIAPAFGSVINTSVTTNTNPGFIINPLDPNTGRRPSPRNNNPNPPVTETDGVCGNIKYTCSAGTVNSKSYNSSSYTWSCVGTSSSASCSYPLGSSQTFNLTRTCTIYEYANNAGCSGVDVGGSAYCWNYDVLTPWGNISAGINLTASYLTVLKINNMSTYLSGSWLQQMPSQPQDEGPITPGVAYVGVLSLECLLGNPEPSLTLSPPENIDAYIDYVECSSICYNHSYAGLISDHRQHDIRIYPYKIINGIKHFSSGYNSYFDVYGTNLIEDTQFPDYNYNINWSWNAVANADGYRILKWDTAEGRVFDHYFDTTSTSFVDGDYSMSWTFGNTVYPVFP